MFGDERQNRFADDFLRRVAEDSGRGGIPAVDDAVEIFRDDRIIGRLDDGRQFAQPLYIDALLNLRAIEVRNLVGNLFTCPRTFDGGSGLCGEDADEEFGAIVEDVRLLVAIHERAERLTREIAQRDGEVAVDGAVVVGKAVVRQWAVKTIVPRDIARANNGALFERRRPWTLPRGKGGTPGGAGRGDAVENMAGGGGSGPVIQHETAERRAGELQARISSALRDCLDVRIAHEQQASLGDQLQFLFESTAGVKANAHAASEVRLESPRLVSMWVDLTVVLMIIPTQEGRSS